MRRIRFHGYKRGSKSARALSRAVGVLRTRANEELSNDDIIINWGSSACPPAGRYINDPEAVAKVGNKATFLMEMAEVPGVPVPKATTDRASAQLWLESGSTLVVRHLLRGSQGRGIQVVRPACDGQPHPVLSSAPLYVEYVKKAAEYRVHVFDGQVIDIQQKKKRQEVPNDEVNYQIRNARFGWVFCRSDVTAPSCVVDAALAACAATGLTFGAVDIGYNEHSKAATVYEVNTAPGLEGTTLEVYTQALLNYLPQLKAGAYLRRRNRHA